MKTFIAAAVACSCLLGAEVDQAITTVSAQNADAKVSQKRIDAYSDESRTLYETYRQTLQQSKRVKAYNEQMQRLIASQQAEITSLDEQIGEVDETNQALIPLMHRMIDALDQFVALDVPFLYDERHDRIARLRSLMDDASVTLAEKYRKIMEAYMAENEYGRTIEAYRDDLKSGNDTVTVDFLRIGRTGLYYQTIDGEHSGMWDKQSKKWITLDSSENGAVKHGLMIAKKQAAPDLLILPVNMKEAE